MKKPMSVVGDTVDVTTYSPQHVLDSDARETEKLITSKYDFDLFNKELDVVNVVYHVKFNAKKEEWHFIKNKRTVSTISAGLFSEKQRLILQDVPGFVFLLSLAKQNLPEEKTVESIRKWLLTYKPVVKPVDKANSLPSEGA